ncbi:MAG: M20 family metallopeptidase [Desulfovibrio sp.]|jgi:succinyl-diaminopimelate desuccinylase|nr:M20 family metallopeptidase [Desulfovibrio sp.]
MHAADPVRLAAELIRYDTTNPPGGEEPALRHLADILVPAGFAVTVASFASAQGGAATTGRASMVACLPGTRPGPALCFAGHIDTVPLGTAAWSVPPLGGEEREGRLYGRGASDMKSGIAAMCAAALRMAGEDARPDMVLCVFGGEETGCEGSFHVARDPDLRAVLGRVGAVVVCEPTRNRPLLGHKGALWLECGFSGRTAHGSMPELGDNALYKAVDAVSRIRVLDFGAPPHAHLGGWTCSVNTLHAGQNTNSVPDRATVRIDIRTIPGQRGTVLARRVAEAAGAGTEMDVLLDIPAVWTEPDHPWVRRAFGLLSEYLDAPPGIESVQFFTDAAALRTALPDTPVLILGPGDPTMAHRTDEFAETAQIRAATDMYAALARQWCARAG